MSDRSKEPVDCGIFAVQHTTEAALLLVDVEGDEYWIPISQISDESEITEDNTEGDEGCLWLPEWLAIEKGLA